MNKYYNIEGQEIDEQEFRKLNGQVDYARVRVAVTEKERYIIFTKWIGYSFIIDNKIYFDIVPPLIFRITVYSSTNTIDPVEQVRVSYDALKKTEAQLVSKYQELEDKL